MLHPILNPLRQHQISAQRAAIQHHLRLKEIGSRSTIPAPHIQNTNSPTLQRLPLAKQATLRPERVQLLQIRKNETIAARTPLPQLSLRSELTCTDIPYRSPPRSGIPRRGTNSLKTPRSLQQSKIGTCRQLGSIRTHSSSSS